MKKLFLFLSFLSIYVCQAQNWGNSLEEAKNQATKEDKKILLVFSGSDWCAPCMKLEKVVWNAAAFKKEASEKWVLLKADFPKKKANQLTASISESNKKLAEKYNKNGNFPLVLLLDKTGKIIGMTGFKNISAEDYIKLISSLQK